VLYDQDDLRGGPSSKTSKEIWPEELTSLYDSDVGQLMGMGESETKE
jgi:hypothetical protein